MREFRDRVAVITGAASGIGRALAERCCDERMRVVLADIERPALALAAQELRGRGATVLAVPTDVSRLADMEALAQRTLAEFGAVHLLCNNAGVIDAGRPIWEASSDDWSWVFGVNLWGAIHGVRVFVPIMLEQQAPSHIVNTASALGLIAGAASGVYAVSKHAVVALSETLALQLAEQAAQVGVSVLCPGLVNTRIFDAERNRPAALAAGSMAQPSPEAQVQRQSLRAAAAAGMAPTEVADHVFAAVREERFYILTGDTYDQRIQARLENILHRRNPGRE